MNLAEMIAAAKTQAQKPAAVKTVKAINPIVDKLLTEGVCISYKETEIIGKLAGGSSWHGGIKFLRENGLGQDAQLLVMNDGQMPNKRNQARLKEFGYEVSGYTEIDHISFLEIVEQAKKEQKPVATELSKEAKVAASKWLANA